MSIRPYLADQWAPLNFIIGTGINDPRPPGVKTWVPSDEQRRLSAYCFLGAMLDNTARYWLPDVDITGQHVEDWIRDKYREYGDPDLLVVSARAALLGEDQSIVVDGADETGENGEPSNTRAAQVQTWLDEWADDVRLPLRLLEQEHDTIGLGDGGLIMGWNAETNRPDIEVFDPGWYFPVLDPSKPSGGFPETVHIAWEEEYAQGKIRVRRKTWRLVTVEAWPPKYLAPGTRPSTKTCLYSEGTWELDKVRGDIYDLAEGSATWATGEDGTELHNLDLQIDFIPLVHIPNTPAGKRHYGTSLLTKVSQLLTDVAATDTDLQESSATTGSTSMVEKGGAGGDIAGGAGLKYNIPTSGDLSYLDTSKNLVALSAYRKEQRDLLSVNSRLPGEVLGRVKASEVASGLLMALSFGPYRSLVSEMRLVRGDKHPLILKFAVRMAVQAGVLPPGDIPRAELTLGSFLPADQSAAVTQVQNLISGNHPAISIETAVGMLMEAGLPIEDPQEEVRRIKAQSFERASQLLDASGDEQAVRDFLGLEGPPPSTLPTPPNAGG